LVSVVGRNLGQLKGQVLLVGNCQLLDVEIPDQASEVSPLDERARKQLPSRACTESFNVAAETGGCELVHYPRNKAKTRQTVVAEPVLVC